MSDGVKQAKGLTYPRKGIGVPSGTITAQFNASPENVRTGQRDEGQRRLSDWMGGGGNYRITEEVVGLGQYGRTLAILTCKSFSMRSEAEPEDDDEDALIES